LTWQQTVSSKTGSEDSGSACLSEVDVMMSKIKDITSDDGNGREEADKLVLLETLGSGASGTVYKGKWRNLDVAVKVRGCLSPHQR
jgi:hypothetical protein